MKTKAPTMRKKTTRTTKTTTKTTTVTKVCICRNNTVYIKVKEKTGTEIKWLWSYTYRWVIDIPFAQKQQHRQHKEMEPKGLHYGELGPTSHPKKGRNVDKACNHCKRSHLRCDNMRPCRRCIATGKSGCKDVEHKPRGRPRLHNTWTKKKVSVLFLFHSSSLPTTNLYCNSFPNTYNHLYSFNYP